MEIVEPVIPSILEVAHRLNPVFGITGFLS